MIINEKRISGMRIVCISDTHALEKYVTVPEGDVLIHAGDFTNVGEMSDVVHFNEWLGHLPHKYKLCIPGNHDLCFEDHEKESKKLLTNAIYLRDSGVEIDGVHFYGSPWQPAFCDWAFNLPRNGRELKGKWSRIPMNTDVLITHGPPFGILDRAPSGQNVGCGLLAKRMSKVKPKFHIFGHIHGGYGYRWVDGETQFINASICTEEYQPTNEPLIFEY
jgi:Icc-related predicted phosphoesterase